MKSKRVILIILAVCVIVAGVYVIVKKPWEKTGKANEIGFSTEATEKFWSNESLFDEAKEYLFAMQDDFYCITFYCDRDNDRIVIPYLDDLEGFNVETSNELIQILLSLDMALRPTPMEIQYFPTGYDVEGSIGEKIIIIQMDSIDTNKGIMYNNTRSERELSGYYNVLDHLKENWYYYEEMAGV